MKFDLILPPCTNMKGLVLRVIRTKFGQNWPTTFRGDVEMLKVNAQWTTHDDRQDAIRSSGDLIKSKSYCFLLGQFTVLMIVS